MNAGAYGGEMKDVIEKVTVLDQDGRSLVLSGEELEFGYRTSRIMKQGYIVVAVCLRLQKGAREDIAAKMGILLAS